MKIGTDGILLGAWAAAAGTRFLDIGTGTGLLSLMLAQRFPDAKIDALELEKDAAARARLNFQESIWQDRLSCFPVALQDWQTEVPYDFLICNPPFFQTGLRAVQPSRSLARHADQLSFADLALHSARLSHSRSQLAMILPVAAFSVLHVQLLAHCWYLRQRCAVQPLPSKTPHRYLLTYHRQSGAVAETHLCIQEGPGQYSDQYRDLTTSFYL